MAVRNQKSRQSKNYIIEKIDGVIYYIEPNIYQSKRLVYSAKKKLQSGKLVIPSELKDTGKTVLVICNGGGAYQFSNI